MLRRRSRSPLFPYTTLFRSAVTNGLADAQACDQALGLSPTSELARARTLLLELEQKCAGAGKLRGRAQSQRLVAGLRVREAIGDCRSEERRVGEERRSRSAP